MLRSTAYGKRDLNSFSALTESSAFIKAALGLDFHEFASCEDS